MKKFLALLLAALMVLSAVACTAPAAPSDGGAAPAAEEEAQNDEGEGEAAPAPAGEVHVLTWSNAATVQYLNSIVDGVFHQYFPVWPNPVNLLVATITGTKTSCHDEKCGIHAFSLSSARSIYLSGA